MLSQKLKLIIVACTLAITCAHAIAAGGNVMTHDREVTMSADQLAAGAVALAEFRERGYSLSNYTVAIRQEPTQFEIAFVPNHPPATDSTVRGGRTALGREIHYWVTRDGQIVKIGFAR